MAASPANPGNKALDVKSLISAYSSGAWTRLLSFVPSFNSNLLAKVLNLYARTSRSRYRRRRSGLPLPLPSKSLELSVGLTKASRIFDVLDDILEHILTSLHHIQKNLHFWQSRAEGSDSQKVYFMVFERGPQAFIDGTFQLIRGCFTEGSSIQHLCYSAAAQISERIAVLTSLRYCLATFLAQVYMEVDKVVEDLIKDPEKSLPSLLMIINSLFLKLEASVSHPHGMSQSNSSVPVDGSNSSSLLFEKLPEVNQDGSQWTDCEIRDAINLIYQNLHKLDSYLSLLVSRYQKPSRMTLYWFRYTCGAVGLSVCSVWLLRHSSLMGSSDINNWIDEARNSTLSFWNDHVEQPLLSIRDELFETFRRRHKGVMEIEEVQLTANSLHRMLLAFSEQTKGQKLPENASDQELLEIVMARYEKELMHPIQNLLGGELARALLIQIQKLKLDIETAMLELDQILRANEINFAILAALPAFFLSLIFLMVVRAWLKQDTRAEGRGRIARLQRRLLIVEVEKRIMQFQTCVDQGLEEDAQCMLGLVLYSLDRLYKAVERHAKATGEWLSLRQDIIDLAKPDLQTAYKLTVTSRIGRVYDCLLPSSKLQ
ncbi:PREDICTED: protein DGS1, mitochondrial isoform X2 [Nelumbo nucifera]|uniref:Protein DGS1, mitochondrial isoform X2 n=1 Tax=Nelumbo nucifera TaxID=4432 RepID=A0A1U7Z1E0_NELNU|nr:PREDICTED: protein DGS1, mitochondrial isoform X2 [Nelumbo nucifera]